MKKIFTSLTCLFFMTGLYAQQHTEIELIRSQFKLEKKAVVADHLKLSNDDAAKFWPVYEKYEAERSAIGDRRIKLLTEYVNEHHKGDVKNADAMVKESADIQRKEVSLREKYYSTVKTAVSPQVALNFFEIEDIIAASVKWELWKELGNH